MRFVVQALARLFQTAARVTTRTGRGLLQHGTGKYAVNAVRRLSISVGGRRIAYSDLGEIDKRVVDEVVEFTTRLAYQYIDHHDEHTQYRLTAPSLDAALRDHADEIIRAAEAAVISRLRSHTYDHVMGMPPRSAMFIEEDARKQLVLGVIAEVADHIATGQAGEAGY